ncbi:hypothetical protein QZH41_008083 [Actinostola sp. cb2023]|nr:hypothetical protein QZH41_008083 [Actinostola sp. cb2023]
MQHNTVHCDIKAANVFIGRNTDGNFLAKLGDFGMVRFEVEQFSKTQVSSTKGFVEGTVAYIAPELLQCGAKQNYKMVEFTLPERSHPWEGEVAFVKQEKRPNIEDSDLNPSEEGKVEWFKLIQDCWNQNPELRPTANTIYSKLSEIVGRNSNTSQHTSQPCQDESTINQNVLNVPLNVHQGSVLEETGEVAAAMFS